MIDEMLNKTYIKNKKRLLSVLKNENISKLIENIDNYLIETNINIFKSNKITKLEMFLYKIDNYITYLKKYLKISSNELTYIIVLTINSEFNSFLFDNNINDLDNNYKELLMYKYNKNIDFLSHYMNINKRNFESLIENINKKKKGVYIYFENITPNNINYFIPIISYLEDINY